MKNINKKIWAAAMLSVAVLMGGCAGQGPVEVSGAHYTKDQSGETENQGILIRGFATHSRYLPVDYDNWALSVFKVITTDHPEYNRAVASGVAQRRGFASITHRYFAVSNQYFSDYDRHYSGAPGLGIQYGDLVDFIPAEKVRASFGAQSLLYVALLRSPTTELSSSLIPIRVVCKWHDEECIARERRDYKCDNGAMVVDGARRPERKCGGFGGHSEEYAGILGPINKLYGGADAAQTGVDGEVNEFAAAVQNYLRAHNSPYGLCVVTTFDCGKAEGKVIPAGKGEYEKWLKTKPNYMAAHEAAKAFADKEGDVSAEERAWGAYLSDNMFSPTPVMPKEEFLRGIQTGQLSVN